MDFIILYTAVNGAVLLYEITRSSECIHLRGRRTRILAVSVLLTKQQTTNDEHKDYN